MALKYRSFKSCYNPNAQYRLTSLVTNVTNRIPEGLSYIDPRNNPANVWAYERARDINKAFNPLAPIINLYINLFKQGYKAGKTGNYRGHARRIRL